MTSSPWNRYPQPKRQPRKWGRVVLVLLLLASAIDYIAPAKMPSKAEKLAAANQLYAEAHERAEGDIMPMVAEYLKDKPELAVTCQICHWEE